MIKKYLSGLTLFVLLAFTVQAQQGPVSQTDITKVNQVLSNRWFAEITPNKDFPYPYINAYYHSPCMYYWDTYFINKGLLASGHLKEARQNTLDLLSVVERFGFIGNENIAPGGMNRSQPPYLSAMVMDVYNQEQDTALLHKAYPLLKREHQFWTDTSANCIEPHQCGTTGLQRYSHHASNGDLVSLYDYLVGRVGLPQNVSMEEKLRVGSAYMAEAASGMDFTPRFEHVCSDFVAVDLNALIYNEEKTLAFIADKLQLKGEPNWNKLAETRKALVNKYCWDDQAGVYLDYNFRTGKKSSVAAASTFQPLWAGMASAKQAKKVMQHLSLFETPYGLRTTVAGSGPKDQWGSTSVWSPMQLIAFDGLNRYGYKAEADRVAAEYFKLTVENYITPRSSVKVDRKPGFTYEKYKVDGSIDDDEYQAAPMMGWTAGVYNYLYRKAIAKD